MMPPWQCPHFETARLIGIRTLGAGAWHPGPGGGGGPIGTAVGWCQYSPLARDPPPKKRSIDGPPKIRGRLTAGPQR